MRNASTFPSRTRLLPEGRRWGFGAHSVRPYLEVMLQSRAGADTDEAQGIRNPVFPQMEQALRGLRRGH